MKGGAGGGSTTGTPYGNALYPLCPGSSCPSPPLSASPPSPGGASILLQVSSLLIINGEINMEGGSWHEAGCGVRVRVGLLEVVEEEEG